METRICCKCKTEKPLCEFYNIKKSKDKYDSYCKKCRNALSTQQSRRRRQLNGGEEIRAYYRNYYAENGYKYRNKEKERQYGRTKYAKHKEKLLLRNKLWRQKNKGKNTARIRKWNKAHPDRISFYRRRREAAIRSCGGSYTLMEWKDLCAKFGNHCLCCGKYFENYATLTVDHIIPVTRGGTSNIDNL